MNESNYKRYQIVMAFLFVLFSILFSIDTVKAANFCVSSASGLETALSIAANNGEDDTVQIVQGNYAGNFVYASTEPSDISIEGGYTKTCASRVVDASNTVLDGSNNDSVLVLSSDQSVNFNVDGLTLQNGIAQTITPSGGTAGGGLNVSTNGSLTLTNCAVNSSSAGSGGGVCVGSSYWANNITVTLFNNTISNNYAKYGGGIYAFGAGMIILSNNTITNNTVGSGVVGSGGGGGVYLHGTGTMSTIILTNNTIKNNTANYMINGFWTGGVWVGGGGVFAESSTITLSNNTIIGNTAKSGSGGVFATASASITLKNNIISDNTADIGGAPPGGGGGVYLYGSGTMSKIILTNNTFTDNTAKNDGGGLMLGFREETAVANIYNNIVWNNNATLSADIYINNDGDGDFLPSMVNLFSNDFDQSSVGTYIQRPFTIDHSNLDKVDPMFVGGGDYHLTADSPCIDTGTNESPSLPDIDFEGDQRILDGDHDGSAKVDIGADEFVPTPLDSDKDGLTDGLENTTCSDPNDADTDDDGISDGMEDSNHNGMVDSGETNPCNIDTDGDGIQDGTELGYSYANIGSDTNTSIFQPDLDPASTTNSLNADSDADGLTDGQEDLNHNGRVDPGETDPNVFDIRTMPWIPLLLTDD